MRILAVLHPGAGLTGLLGERAARGGHELVEWMPAEAERLPGRLAAFDAAVVFGGGMNVRDAERLPWLHGEIELLRDALAARLPVLGVCLGAQLVAAAAGAEVRRAPAPEIGWFEVELTAAGTDDPVLGRLPERFTAYEWHSYAFDHPAGAVELARSAVCSQAFRLGDAAWAVQFHPEVTPEIVRAWALDYESDPDAVSLGLVPAEHIAVAERRLPEWMALGRRLFDGFLEAATEQAAAGRAARPAAAAAAPGPPPLRG
jgi:GMP synthase-like glutamine amidotransferase